jgi:pimeloyl-ACP methyl ester carboxylesterase
MTDAARIEFDSTGIRCVGHLYRPAAVEAPNPCVVLAHGFGGTQDTPSFTAIARAFAAAGFFALTFDYRSFGESDGKPRQVIDLDGQLRDIRAAIAFARHHAEIDPERIALWGTSLGGGHAVVVAAADPRLAAVIAQIPFNGFPDKVEGRSALATVKLLGAALWDAIRGRLGLAPYYIRAVGAQGELAVMATPQAQQTIAAMDSANWRNQVAPRALLQMMRYKPGDHVARLSMPLLVCIAAEDRETPPQLARELAERAPYGESREYPVSHFEFYRDDMRARVLRDQIAFLRRHLRRVS